MRTAGPSRCSEPAAYRLQTGSPIGPLSLYAGEGALTGIVFGELEGAPAPSALLEQAAEELEEYFAGKRRRFTVPVAPKGTAFQRRVWDALREIPYGTAVCYKDVAVMAGRPGAAIAVGQANRRNPIPVVIPCHRVIGADGSLTGYSGGLEIKRALLALEGVAQFG